MKVLNMRCFKVFLYIVILFLWSPLMATGPCDNNIQYSCKKNPDSSYRISLRSEETLTNVKIQLYDLYTGKVIDEKTIGTLTNKDIEVFADVKESVYSIIIKIAGCDKSKSLGGIEGINLANQVR